MPKYKNCCFNKCRNNTTAASRSYMEGILFFPFPKPKRNLAKCMEWIKACGRPDFLTLDRITKDRFVCSEHFVDGKGPSEKYPNPMLYDPILYMIDPRNVKDPQTTRFNHSVNELSYATTSLNDLANLDSGFKTIKDEILDSVDLNSDVKTLDDEMLDSVDLNTDVKTIKDDMVDSITLNSDAKTLDDEMLDCVDLNTDVKTIKDEMLDSVDLNSDARTFRDDFLSSICSGSISCDPAQSEKNFDSSVKVEVVDAGPENQSVDIIFSQENNVQIYSPNIIRSEIMDTCLDVSLNSSIINLEDLSSQFLKLQINNHACAAKWALTKSPDFISLFDYNNLNDTVGRVKIEITKDLELKLKVYGKSIYNDHLIKKSGKFPYSIKTINDLIAFLNLLEEFNFCPGNIETEMKTSNLFCGIGFLNYYTNAMHSNDCDGIFGREEKLKRCKNCGHTRKLLKDRLRSAKKAESQPVNKRNFRYINETQHKKLWTRNQNEKHQLRKQIKRLQSKISKLEEQMKSEIRGLDSKLFDGILDDDPFCNTDNFQRLLIREQIKLLKNQKSRPAKWHPAIIKWCLYIKSKSTSAYEAAREVLLLPSTRCLIKHSSVFPTKSVFTFEALREMKDKINLQAVEEHKTLI